MGDTGDPLVAPEARDGLEKEQSKRPASPLPAPPAEGCLATAASAGSGLSPQPSANSGGIVEASQDNPFGQYYAQLTHQQNMLQDSVRVSAYQQAILDNMADFKVSYEYDLRRHQLLLLENSVRIKQQ